MPWGSQEGAWEAEAMGGQCLAFMRWTWLCTLAQPCGPGLHPGDLRACGHFSFAPENNWFLEASVPGASGSAPAGSSVTAFSGPVTPLPQLPPPKPAHHLPSESSQQQWDPLEKCVCGIEL